MLRELPAALAALIAGLVAAFGIADHNFAEGIRGRHWYNVPATHCALYLVVAVVTALIAARYGSRRAAWITAGLGAAVVGVATVMCARSVTGELGEALALAALAAGVVLGGAVAAVWGRRPGQAALTIGLIGGWLVAPPWAAVSGNAVAPPWLPPLAVFACAAAAVATSPGFRIPRPDAVTTWLLPVGALAVAGATRLGTAWIDGAGPARTTEYWVAGIGTAAALTAIVAGLAWRALPTDGEFLLAGCAVAAAAAPVLTVYSAPPARISVVWLVLAALVGVLAGTRTALVRPHALIGFGVLAVLPATELIDFERGDDGALLALRIAILGLGAGLALAASFPMQAPAAALGLGLPVSATAFTALFAEPPDVLVDAAGRVAIGSVDRTLPALIVLAVVAACAALVVAHRRRPAH